ncbi:phage integrase family protein [Fimbriiglobus ruber]|uniref:Phage integrase family protein n=1 Tax=Fimbriiglobus ruber TaxID=1908690 RepID=A0A225DY57_9BACT|nr:phage integrase family protein [Fimbriiglobus ruber]
MTPGLIGRYFDQHPGSIPSKKLALAALRALFDRLVNRHVLILNPAATVRGERYQVQEGRTPEISAEQVRQLLGEVDTSRPVGLRDRAILGVLVYTAARAGAVARLRRGDLESDGTQYLLRFREKGNRIREIPVRHDLQQFLLAYLDVTSLLNATKEAPLFPSCVGRTGVLTATAVSGNDICRMVKRRLSDHDLPGRLSPHSFRVATITNLLTNGAALEDVQFLAGHADPRTTRLYDRRQKAVTRNLVERISL